MEPRLYIREINKCSECPHLQMNYVFLKDTENSPFFPKCSFNSKKLYFKTKYGFETNLEMIPDWCPLERVMK